MKLVVFLKDKRKVVIRDGKYFLSQWYKGSKEILLTKKKKITVARHDIKDFIQARYYELCKHLFVTDKRAY